MWILTDSEQKAHQKFINMALLTKLEFMNAEELEEDWVSTGAMSKEKATEVLSGMDPNDLILAAAGPSRVFETVTILRAGEYQDRMVAAVQTEIRRVVTAGVGVVELQAVLSPIRSKAALKSSVGISAITLPG